MVKNDARIIPDTARIFLKKRAKELRNSGKSYREISDILGVHINTASNWLSTQKGPFQATFKKRGRKTGELRTLTREQEKEIQRLIRDKTPEQMKLPFALWTRKTIRDLIHSLYGYTMPIRTIGEYLKRWGYTPQRPLKRAYEQRPTEIKKWLEETYPQIRQRAKTEKAEIHWGDETGINNQINYGRSYAPAGITPAIRNCAQKFSTSMISSITNQGKLRFMVYKGGMNVEVFKRFCLRLVKDCKKKLFLIVDNLRVHHAHILQEWLALETVKAQIEVFFLPAYAPERNPDEYLNNDIKRGVAAKAIPRTRNELIGNIIAHMRSLQKQPEHVTNFFKHPLVNYAAA